MGMAGGARAPLWCQLGWRQDWGETPNLLGVTELGWVSSPAGRGRALSLKSPLWGPK